jgi:hypothetical protein
MTGPLAGADGDPGAPTINVKNVNGSAMAPLGGARAGDPGASNINAKKHQWWAPWEMPELDIREHPPSMLRDINGELPGGAWANGYPGVPTINIKKCRRWAPWEVPELDIQECPPSTLRNIDGGPPGGC